MIYHFKLFGIIFVPQIFHYSLSYSISHSSYSLKIECLNFLSHYLLYFQLPHRQGISDSLLLCFSFMIFWTKFILWRQIKWFPFLNENINHLSLVTCPEAANCWKLWLCWSWELSPIVSPHNLHISVAKMLSRDRVVRVMSVCYFHSGMLSVSGKSGPIDLLPVMLEVPCGNLH